MLPLFMNLGVISRVNFAHVFFFKNSALILLCFFLLSCDKTKEPADKPLSFVIVQEAIFKNNLISPSTTELSSKKNDWVIADNAGWVVEKLIKNGEFIKAGQTILRLDPRDIRLSDSAARTQFEAAKASLKARKLDFERFNELKTKKFISQAEWERRRAQLAVHEADFERLADKLGVVSIRSFEDGIIQSMNLYIGDFVKTGDKVARIITKKKRNFRKPRPLENEKSIFSNGVKIPTTSLIDGEYVFLVIPRKNDEGKRIGKGFIKKAEVETSYVDESIVILNAGLENGDIFVVTGGNLLTEGQEVRFSY